MNRYTNYFIGVLLACLGTLSANAQTPTFFYPGGNSGNAFPLSSTTSNKVQWLYTPADWNTAPAPGNITKVYFKVLSSAATTTFTNLTVKLSLPGITSLPPGASPWLPATTVYSATTTFTGVVSGNWISIAVTSPFYYPGNVPLLVELSQSGYTTGLTAAQGTLPGNRRMYGGLANPNANGADGNAVGFGFDTSPSAPNNASTVSIPSPVNFCPGTYPVKALIKNNGSNVITNLKVDWTLDGTPQPQISFNYPLDTFGGAGINDTLLTLGNVTFAPSITRIVKVWTSLPNGVQDTINMDDTVIRSIRPALSGVYTVNGTNPDFPTLDSAASALNLYGVCGPVTMDVRSGTYTNQRAALGNIAGASQVNRITFKPEANVTGAVTFSGTATAATNNFFFQLNNASFVTVKNFLFTPLSTSFGRTLELGGGASNDSFIHNKVTMPLSNGTSNNVSGVFANGLTGQNIVIQNDTFINGNYHMYFWGSSTTAMTQRARIENNVFTNPYYYGVYLYYQASVKFRNNTMTTNGPTFSTLYGVNAYFCYDSSLFVNNTVTFAPTTVATMYPFYIYQNTGSTLAKGIIEGNRIRATGTTSAVYGLTHYYGVNSIVKNNTVLSTTTTGACYGLYDWYPTSCEYYNNTFHAQATTAATNYGGYLYNTTTYTGSSFYNNVFSKGGSNGTAMYVYSPTYQQTDHNLLFAGTGTNLVQSIVTPGGTYPTLQAWRTASNQDRNSLVYRPPFTNVALDLTPNPADSAAWALHGRGIHIPGNTYDINGQPRVTTRPAGVPDIGAWEFTPTSNPPRAIATPATPVAGGTQVFTFGQDTVETITWAPGSTVPTSITVQNYSGTMPPPVFPTGDFMWFYNQINATGSGTYNYTANTYYDEPWRGTNVVETALRLAKKDGTNPWVTYPAPTSSVNTVRNFISASNLTTLNSAFTGQGENCNGGNTLPSVITNAPITQPRCAGDSIVLTADDPNNLAAMQYQWQYSFTNAPGSFTDVVNGSGANSLNYTTAPLTDTIWYRIRTKCSSGGADTPSAAYFVPVIKALVLTKTDTVRCGPGTANLYATVTPGATLSWYANPTGGNVLGTGSPFTTPVLTQTDTFYAEASAGGIGQQTVGPVIPNNVSTSISWTTVTSWRENFTVTGNLTLQSVDIFPNASSPLNSVGSVRIFNTANVLVNETFYTVQVNSGTAPQTVVLNATLAPGNYYMVQGTPQFLAYNFGGAVYPYTSPLLNITSSSASTTYFTFFYNWKYNNSCLSQRTPVIATVLTPPPFAVTADRTVCNGEITNLTVTTPQSNYDTVGWAPLNDLYTNPAATIPYTGNSAFSVYAKSVIPGPNPYIVTAYAALNNCTVKDTVTLFVQPPTANLTALPDTICVSGSTLLQIGTNLATFAPNSVFYQSSASNLPGSYTTVFGPTAAASYQTPVLTSSTFYRIQVMNSNNVVCKSDTVKVSVSSPAITSTVGSQHCGPGPVTLLAYGSPNTTLRWYATPTGGGQPLQTGGTYTTPILFQTTTFYVTASTDNDTGTVGPVSPSAVSGSVGTGVLNNNYTQFDVLTNTTLKTVDIFPTSAINTPGSIQILNSANNVVATVNYVTTVTGGAMQRVTMNVNLPAATGYRMRQGPTSPSLTYNLSGSAYPYTSSDIVITGNNFVNSNYLFFYNWKWLSGCESPRVPVTAVITPSPDVEFTPPTYDICFGDTTTITAVSTNPGYQFEWTQLGVYGPVITVTPQVTTDYYLFSIDTSNGPFAGCTHYDTARVTVFPRPAADVYPLNVTTFCAGDSVRLVAVTNPAYTYQWQINGGNIPGATDTMITVFAPGNYTIRTLLGFCYQTSLPEQVIVNPLPNPVITSSNNVLSTDPYASYQWIKDGQIIYGATNQFYVPQGPGDYEVAVTDIYGCTNTSSVYRFDAVGIPNVNGVGGVVRIKPNPVRDVLIIEAPVEVTAVITTLDGRLITRQVNAKRINMQAIADGVYMLRVLDKEGRNLKTEKIVKTSW